MTNQEFEIEVSILKKRVEQLESENVTQKEALNKISSKKEVWWNPINIILGIIFVSAPLVMASLGSLYWDTRNQLSELTDITETTSLLIDAQSEFQKNNLYYDQGRFELVIKSTDDLITKAKRSYKKINEPLKDNVKNLLLSLYSYNAVSQYNVDPVGNAGKIEKIAKEMIELDNNYWKGYQLLAIAQSEQKEDYKLIADNFEKSIRKSDGGFNPNGINLPELYFIHNDFPSCAKWAKKFEEEQFENDITKFRDKDGQIAHHFLFNISNYIISGNETFIDTFNNRINAIKEERTGGYDWDDIKSWVEELRANNVKSDLMTAQKREKILLLFDDQNKIKQEIPKKDK